MIKYYGFDYCTDTLDLSNGVDYAIKSDIEANLDDSVKLEEFELVDEVSPSGWPYVEIKLSGSEQGILNFMNYYDSDNAFDLAFYEDYEV